MTVTLVTSRDVSHTVTSGHPADICFTLVTQVTNTRLGIRGTGTGQNFVTLVTPWTKSLNSDFGHIPRRITRCDIRSPSRDMFQTSVTQVTDADLSQTL